MRDHHIDLYRGIAFIQMAIYHLLFNLYSFNFTTLNLFTNSYAIIWRGFIIGTFLVCAGVSLVLLYKKAPNDFIRRAFKSSKYLLLSALLVSFATYLIFPHYWIYFGILHFMLLAKLFALFFVPHPRLSLFVGISIIIAFFIIGSWNPFMPYYGVGILPLETLDMVNILPWLGVFFIGIFLGHYRLYKHLPYYPIKSILWMGKYPLFLYLAHQAVLFPLVYLMWFLSF